MRVYPWCKCIVIFVSHSQLPKGFHVPVVTVLGKKHTLEISVFFKKQNITKKPSNAKLANPTICMFWCGSGVMTGPVRKFQF